LVNFRDELGNTPIFYALDTGESCVSLLLQSGADILVTNKQKLRPIDTIKNDPHKEYFYNILSKHGEFTRIFFLGITDKFFGI
jgi:ankyrin repeat protein